MLACWFGRFDLARALLRSEAEPRRSWTAQMHRLNDRPVLQTVDEVAALLRTSPTAVYAMVARRQLPGVTRLGRRVLFRTDDLLRWLDQNRAPSPKE